MRSIWKGSISFGLVYIPVRLYAATEDKSISFNLLHRRCGSRVRYQRWCPHCRTALEQEDIVRGYAYAPDQYVILEDQDFEDLPVPTARTIQIHNFVELGAIDPVYYERSYYLEPAEGGQRAYTLLREAMHRTERAALAKVAIRARESLACLRVFDDRTLILETMRYPDEIRPTTALAGLQEQVAVEEAELELAIHLIQRLAGPFEPQRYQDQYRLALQERIEARIQGRDVTRAPAGGPVSPPVADLLAALRASLENGAQAAGAAQQLQPTPPP
ncbi:MAG TPA: Ku protein [Sphingobacteriaceae bacterium]|nr:Ku protein [Sphingobacteriaceae bacterium]